MSATFHDSEGIPRRYIRLNITLSSFLVTRPSPVLLTCPGLPSVLREPFSVTTRLTENPYLPWPDKNIFLRLSASTLPLELPPISDSFKAIHSGEHVTGGVCLYDCDLVYTDVQARVHIRCLLHPTPPWILEDRLSLNRTHQLVSELQGSSCLDLLQHEVQRSVYDHFWLF